MCWFRMNNSDKKHGSVENTFSTTLIPVVSSGATIAKLAQECYFNPKYITDILDIMGTFCNATDEIVSASAARNSGKIGRADVFFQIDELEKRVGGFVPVDL